MHGRIEKLSWLRDSSEAIYCSIEETRHSVVYPRIIESIIDRRPASVLDYGAGDGTFLARLRDLYPGKLYYFDPSHSMNLRAHNIIKNKNIKDFKDPQCMPAGGVDIVVSIAVWMTLSNHDACVQYLLSQNRILDAGGRALIAVTHPCFRTHRFSSYSTSFTNDAYLNEGSPFEVNIFDKANSVKFVDYHWSLSCMLQQSREAGFRLTSLEELAEPRQTGRSMPSWILFEFERAN